MASVLNLSLVFLFLVVITLNESYSNAAMVRASTKNRIPGHAGNAFPSPGVNGQTGGFARIFRRNPPEEGDYFNFLTGGEKRRNTEDNYFDFLTGDKRAAHDKDGYWNFLNGEDEEKRRGYPAIHLKRAKRSNVGQDSALDHQLAYEQFLTGYDPSDKRDAEEWDDFVVGKKSESN